jgi:hypothetical protein
MIVRSGRLGRRAWWRRAAAMFVAWASRKMPTTRLLLQVFGHGQRLLPGLACQCQLAAGVAVVAEAVEVAT